MKRLTLMFLGFVLVSSGSCVLAPTDIPMSDAKEPTPGHIRVMIIDSGISPIPEIKPFLSTVNAPHDLEDNHGHGTHITGLVLYGPKLDDKVCPEVEIYSCKFFKPEVHKISNCFRAAQNMGIDIVNFSGGGRENDEMENEAVKAFKGTIVVAAGNHEVTNGKVTKEAWDISEEPYYPASLNLPNMKVVGNGRSESTRNRSSNYGLPGMVWRNGENIWSFDKTAGQVRMSGSSQATAIYTHDLLKAKCQRLRSAK